jgi:hypothetical protein
MKEKKNKRRKIDTGNVNQHHLYLHWNSTSKLSLKVQLDSSLALVCISRVRYINPIYFPVCTRKLDVNEQKIKEKK